MQKEKIKELATLLLNSVNEKDIHFGIKEYGGEQSDEFCIEASQSGLRLFSAELLMASITDNENKTYPLNTEIYWSNEDLHQIDYVEITEKEQKVIEETWKEKLIIIGVLLFTILTFLCLLVGIVTIVGFVYDFLNT